MNDATATCYEWLRDRSSPPPTAAQVEEAAIAHIREWRAHLASGMDVLASAEMDHAIELLLAVRAEVGHSI